VPGPADRPPQPQPWPASGDRRGQPGQQRPDLARVGQPLCALLRAGVVDPTAVASERVSLDDVPAAYRRMAQRSTLKALVLA